MDALKVIVFTQEIIFWSNELEEVRKIAIELLERENTLKDKLTQEKDKLAQEKDKLAEEKDRVIDVTNDMIALSFKNMEMSNQIADISRKLFATTPRDVIGTTCLLFYLHTV